MEVRCTGGANCYLRCWRGRRTRAHQKAAERAGTGVRGVWERAGGMSSRAPGGACRRDSAPAS
eukprot:2111716-Lingulodinium_polyedra.AAC.1